MGKDSLKKVDRPFIYRSRRLFWGMPPQIVAAINDKECPRCGRTTRDDLGLDLGMDNGEYFGGLCFHCGWSF